jgi:acetyl-CoA carboxylase biotin carboxyl carrier protein
LSLNATEVAEILKALEASSFDSLDLEIGGVKLSLRRRSAALAASTSSPPAAADTPPGAPVPVVSASTAPAASPVAVAPVSAAPDSTPPVEGPPGTHAVTAPLLGVFYRAPKPGEPPFVEVGSRVEPDTIIGIIEVMKLMNTVRAGLRGQVVAIAARNGELVEYGEALMFVRPD